MDIACLGCDEEKPIAAHGLCWACYARVSRRRRFDNSLRITVCARCREVVEGRCWVCESHEAMPGKAACRTCQNAFDALSSYWRSIGMALSYEGQVTHPTRRTLLRPILQAAL